MTEITEKQRIVLKLVIIMNLNLSKIHFERPRSRTTREQLVLRLFCVQCFQVQMCP